jgi:hypothetical protein
MTMLDGPPESESAAKCGVRGTGFTSSAWARLDLLLDSWPAIKVNRERSGEFLRPARGVKTGTKGVKRIVIASRTTRNVERKKGFEPSTSTLASGPPG